MVEELAGVVAGELKSLAETGPEAAELQRSKAQLKAGLADGALESSSVRAEQMARHLLSHDRIISPAELTRHGRGRDDREGAGGCAQQLLDSKRVGCARRLGPQIQGASRSRRSGVRSS